MEEQGALEEASLEYQRQHESPFVTSVSRQSSRRIPSRRSSEDDGEGSLHADASFSRDSNNDLERGALLTRQSSRTTIIGRDAAADTTDVVDLSGSNTSLRQPQNHRDIALSSQDEQAARCPEQLFRTNQAPSRKGVEVVLDEESDDSDDSEEGNYFSERQQEGLNLSGSLRLKSFETVVGNRGNRSASERRSSGRKCSSSIF